MKKSGKHSRVIFVGFFINSHSMIIQDYVNVIFSLHKHHILMSRKEETFLCHKHLSNKCLESRHKKR